MGNRDRATEHQGFITQNCVHQKWPDQIFPIANFAASHNGHFGPGGGGGVGTRPWWLALLACGGAYWPLANRPGGEGVPPPPPPAVYGRSGMGLRCRPQLGQGRNRFGFGPSPMHARRRSTQHAANAPSVCPTHHAWPKHRELRNFCVPPSPPCLSYAKVRNQYGPYAYCSLDKAVACARHIQLPAHMPRKGT